MNLDELVVELKNMDVFNITIINTPDYLTDYFVIGSVNNLITLKAIIERFREKSIVHGEADSGWVILDFGDFWCHLFLPKLRDYYNIERIWALREAMKKEK